MHTTKSDKILGFVLILGKLFTISIRITSLAPDVDT